MDTIPIAAKDATVEFDGIGTSMTEQFEDDPKYIYKFFPFYLNIKFLAINKYMDRWVERKKYVLLFS